MSMTPAPLPLPSTTFYACVRWGGLDVSICAAATPKSGASGGVDWLLPSSLLRGSLNEVSFPLRSSCLGLVLFASAFFCVCAAAHGRDECSSFFLFPSFWLPLCDEALVIS